MPVNEGKQMGMPFNSIGNASNLSFSFEDIIKHGLKNQFGY